MFSGKANHFVGSGERAVSVLQFHGGLVESQDAHWPTRSHAQLLAPFCRIEGQRTDDPVDLLWDSVVMVC